MPETRLTGLIRELLSVETLEYENKNWLQNGTEPAKLSRDKQSLINIILFEADQLEKEHERCKQALAMAFNR